MIANIYGTLFLTKANFSNTLLMITFQLLFSIHCKREKIAVNWYSDFAWSFPMLEKANNTKFRGVSQNNSTIN